MAERLSPDVGLLALGPPQQRATPTWSTVACLCVALNQGIRAGVIIPEQAPAPTAMEAMVMVISRKDSITEGSESSRVSVVELERRTRASETVTDAVPELRD